MPYAKRTTRATIKENEMPDTTKVLDTMLRKAKQRLERRETAVAETKAEIKELEDLIKAKLTEK